MLDFLGRRPGARHGQMVGSVTETRFEGIRAEVSCCLSFIFPVVYAPLLSWISCYSVSSMTRTLFFWGEKRDSLKTQVLLMFLNPCSPRGHCDMFRTQFTLSSTVPPWRFVDHCNLFLYLIKCCVCAFRTFSYI